MVVSGFSLVSSNNVLPTWVPSTDPTFSDGESKGLEIGEGKDLAIKVACFSENGDWLFVWASGNVYRGYLYGMNGQDANLVGEVSYEKVPFRSYFCLHDH